MNDFEKNVQSKDNDFVHALNGFNYSFLFFAIIFVIGALIKALMT